ncbi:MAG: FkbM family methyltransferase [Butyrivibrio sp.]|nr:FkbM family methyltransferase [Butyrivibrio sp.]
MDKYVEILNEIIDNNRQYQYEEVSLAFIASKLLEWGGHLLLRSDSINERTYWMIRYYRAKGIEPLYIISTEENEKQIREILNIRIISKNNLADDVIKNGVLVVINETPLTFFQKVVKRIRKPAAPKFLFVANWHLEFARERGMQNYRYMLEHREEYNLVLDSLEDDISKNTFIEIIRALIENDIFRYTEYESQKKYFDSEIYESLEAREVWINFGACSGDTILHYLSDHKKFSKIYAIEKADNWIKHLRIILSFLPEEINKRITIIPKEFGDRNSICNLDNYFENEDVSLINMDIEGAELIVLDGAEKLIKEKLPVLCIAAYHEPSHMIEIPKMICNYSDQYKIYLRKYRGYCPDAINEYVYYAVPTKRISSNKSAG